MCDLINAPLHEVLEGSRILSSLGVNASKGSDLIILSPEWK